LLENWPRPCLGKGKTRPNPTRQTTPRRKKPNSNGTAELRKDSARALVHKAWPGKIASERKNLAGKTDHTDERESDQVARSLENGQENPNHGGRKSLESLAPVH
jgi:hypothetical protein